jgi:hypothetical protein
VAHRASRYARRLSTFMVSSRSLTFLDTSPQLRLCVCVCAVAKLVRASRARRGEEGRGGGKPRRRGVSPMSDRKMGCAVVSIGRFRASFVRALRSVRAVGPYATWIRVLYTVPPPGATKQFACLDREIQLSQRVCVWRFACGAPRGTG